MSDQKQAVIDAIDKAIIFLSNELSLPPEEGYVWDSKAVLRTARAISDLTYARDNLTREPRKDNESVSAVLACAGAGIPIGE